jgi:hypothetical protein
MNNTENLPQTDTTQEIGEALAEKVAFLCNTLKMVDKEPKVVYQEKSNRVKITCDNEKCFLSFHSYKQWDEIIDRFTNRLCDG